VIIFQDLGRIQILSIFRTNPGPKKYSKNQLSYTPKKELIEAQSDQKFGGSFFDHKKKTSTMENFIQASAGTSIELMISKVLDHVPRKVT